MSSRRDSGLFAPSTLPRSLAGEVARNGSHESLTAHPLLSPTLPGSSASSVSSTSGSLTDVVPPTSSVPPTRYVPYTPRQRTAVATGTTMHSSVQASSQNHSFHGDATSKLQLMNLKAAAQTGGLDSASTGWAILERLGTETDHGPEWNDIWNALSNSKATLLLPLDTHPANETITVEFIKDHIALCDGPNRQHAPVVTLSGLRGILDDETLTIRSTLNPTSKHFQAILNPTTRSSALAALPPLALFTPTNTSTDAPASIPNSPTQSPTPHKSAFSTASKPQYPTFSLPLHHHSLPLPPRPNASGSSPSKPPLPPRPNVRSVSLTAASTPPPSAPQAAAARLSTSFASLFGRAATPPPPASPTVTVVPLQPDHHSSDGHPEPGIGVPAFTLNTRIVRRDVAKAILKAIHGEIRTALDLAPSWVSERTEDFVGKHGLLPFVKNKPKNKLGTPTDSGPGAGYTVTSELKGEDGVEELGREFQEFYIDLEEELFRRKWRLGKQGFGLGMHMNGSASVGSASSGDEKEKEKESTAEEKDGEDQVEDEKEKRVRDVMEIVERTICSIFYDRLFLQSCSDDASHDEALSSRIAAVNMLDLSLAHLGVDVGTSATEVEAVVKACGETLSQLDTACRAPADKAAVLVASHKIIVDGLSRLPPIGLKSDEEHLDEKTPRAGTFGQRNPKDTSVDDDDDSDKPAGLSSVPPVDSDKTIVLEDSSKFVLSPQSDAPPETPFGENAGTITGKAPPAPLNVKESEPSASSPKLTISPAPPTNPTPVSGDIILPLMIFAVVKINPPRLVSHLLYTQRFRYQGVGGEESYCLINLLAVAEFLENVDLAALGLGEKEKTVLSTAELTPIPVTRAAQPPSPRSIHSSLRGRVEQQVDAITGSANKVISGVVDSSFGVLRSFLPGAPTPDATATVESAELQDSAPWNTSKPGFGLLRRDTAFSIASLAASLPGASRPKKDEESGQQLLEVPSRPGSSRSIRVDDVSSSAESGGDEEDDDDEEEEYEEEEYDTRSIRSFESMMSARSGKVKRKGRQRINSTASGRKSLADRLASVPGLSRLSGSQPTPLDTSKGSPPPSRRSSLLLPHPNFQPPQPSNRFDTPLSSRGASPVAIRISPPNPRFLECTVDDIKVSEVGQLLKEYKRLVEAVRAMGGFYDE